MILKERELKHSGVKIDKNILFVFCLLDLKCKFAMNVTTWHSPQALKARKKDSFSFVNDSLGRRFECLLSCTQEKKYEKKEIEKLFTLLLLLTSSNPIENREST